MRFSKFAAAMVITLAGSAAMASPVTWSFNVPWDFYTANNPAQGNLVGTMTFDRAITSGYPVAWNFSLEHHDPIFAAYYPMNISWGWPNSETGGQNVFICRDDVLSPFTLLRIAFPTAAGTLNQLVDGTVPSMSFAADEYVQRGSISSQRRILNGTATLVPAPGPTALLAAAAIIATRRRRAA